MPAGKDAHQPGGRAVCRGGEMLITDVHEPAAPPDRQARKRNAVARVKLALGESDALPAVGRRCCNHRHTEKKCAMAAVV